MGIGLQLWFEVALIEFWVESLLPILLEMFGAVRPQLSRPTARTGASLQQNGINGLPRNQKRPRNVRVRAQDNGFDFSKVGDWIYKNTAPVRARIMESFSGEEQDEAKKSRAMAVRDAVKFANEGDILGAMKALNSADTTNADSAEIGLIYFNKACLYCRLDSFEEAAENLITAIIKYDAPYKNIFTDKDIKIMNEKRPELIAKVRKEFAKKQRQIQ